MMSWQFLQKYMYSKYASNNSQRNIMFSYMTVVNITTALCLRHLLSTVILQSNFILKKVQLPIPNNLKFSTFTTPAIPFQPRT